ncbi:MAG: polyhydroxyalkanoate synthesis repressor PhaR [Oceanospirillaceae bacterium]
MITIKKYPNRRLYDTSTSQYVNLDYIRKLVLEHTDFEIVSSKDGSNLTKIVLLQIISEAETNDQQSLLTDSLLKQLIRFHDGDMQVFVRQYLDQSMSQFLEQQESVQGMMKNLVDSSPMGVFGKMMEKNMDMWNINKGDANKNKTDNND